MTALISTVPTGPSGKTPKPERSQRFRPDIQALRALAIVLVVANHLWPTRLTGGYVGVDAFFVISGFLITAHLFHEVESSGRIRLGQFYGRRIRRLLPAALLVLAVAAALVWVFLPYTRWVRNGAEIAASGVYIENWLLSAMSVNYSALNDAASVAQHYWSLSVEEQFYLLWPVLLLIGLWVSRRIRVGSSHRRRSIAILSLIAGLSLVASIAYTIWSPPQAYFATFTRAWEFAVGGLIALTAHRLRVGRLPAAVMSGAGFAAILIAAVSFGPQTPFPGWAAILPAIGTGAIIAAGTSGSRAWHTPLTSSAPVQWLGDVSYSLYLWHWPLIVVVPFVIHSEPTTLSKFAVLALAIVLAGLTKTFVEDPARRARVWNGSVGRSLIGMSVGMFGVCLIAGALFGGAAARAAADARPVALPTGSCAGPNALQHVSKCPNAFGAPASTVMTTQNSPFFSPPECVATDELAFGRQTTRVCDFSGGRPDPAHVWLVGDSHAEHWQAAVFELASEHHWLVTISLFGGCPAADVAFIGFREPAPATEVADCRSWSHAVSARILADRPQAVITSMAARLQLVDDKSGRSQSTQFVDGLMRDWSAWSEAGITVLPIADPPLNGAVRSPDCVALHAQNPIQCARPRAEAQPLDPIVLAADKLKGQKVHLIDLTSSFCDAKLCYAVVGQEPVYYDADHLNRRYVHMLVPQLDHAISEGLLTASH